MAENKRQKYVFIHQLSESEYIELYRVVSDSRTMKWMGDGRPWTVQKLLELRNFSAKDYATPWKDRNYFYWAILPSNMDTSTGSSHVVGLVGLHPAVPPLVGLQITYAISPKERGKGHATLAVQDIMAMPEVREDPRPYWAIIRPDNKPSLRVIEKSGCFDQDSEHPTIEFLGRQLMIFRGKK